MMECKRARRSVGTITRSGGHAAGFTLVEMLIAVGAVAFVAVGIATIFRSVGDTVSRGRSVSSLTQFASVLERQMREDFAAMTRDGFLVIRHEIANEGNPVPLYADQPIGQWRPRRVDEIMFFVNRPSRSAREPVAPGFVPEGPSARIYYGHGQRRRPDPDITSAYALPDIVDDNRTGDLLGRNTPGNPNRLAGQWTLLRHETTLVSVGGGVGDAPPLTGGALTASPDNRLQVALQPAAQSIFRSVNALTTTPCPSVFPDVRTVRREAGATSANPNQSPIFESGIVDVATTNLQEIRGIVTASPGLLEFPGTPVRYTYISPVDLTDCSDYFGPASLVGPVGVQQAWMMDAWPAPSHPVALNFNRNPIAPGIEPNYSSVNIPLNQRARMRFEDTPPDIYSRFADVATNPVLGAIRMADQQALASSAFVPRVSQFIVEWSFGKLDEEGQVIWHGAEREIDYDRDGTVDQTVYPYPRYDRPVRGTPADLAGSFFVPYRLRSTPTTGTPGVGTTPRRFTSIPRLGDPITDSLSGNFASPFDTHASFPVLPEVVHGVRTTGLGTTAGVPTVSYFGYTLPFFDPEDPDNDGNTADAAATPTMDWPWPELIRVTVTLTDPGDETIERTFQYVFPTPGNPVR